MKNTEKTMDKIVALCKGRGFVYPGSEIYGGLANSWDYGPLGVELKNNGSLSLFGSGEKAGSVVLGFGGIIATQWILLLFYMMIHMKNYKNHSGTYVHQMMVGY